MKLRIFTEPQQGASYEQLLAVARCAEECGFDAFFRSDHYLRMGEGDARPGPTDAWITLAGLARDTSRIRLGTLSFSPSLLDFLESWIMHHSQDEDRRLAQFIKARGH